MNKFEHTVLIIDDDDLNITSLTHLLSDEFNVFSERNGSKSLAAAREHKPDVILLDVVMPDMNGFEVIDALKKDEETKNIPVIFITGLNNTKDEEQGLVLGAVDYINKPFSSYIVKLRIKNQLQITAQMKSVHEQSKKDNTTGLGTRSSFTKALELEWAKASESGQPLSFAMLCVNDFAQYNEEHGHPTGDDALRHLSQSVLRKVPWMDEHFVRWDEDVFAILFENSGISEAKQVLEDVLQDISRREVQNTSLPPFTISIGLHSHVPTPRGGYSADEFMLDTASALAHAKKVGKENISIFDEIGG